MSLDYVILSKVVPCLLPSFFIATFPLGPERWLDWEGRVRNEDRAAPSVITTTTSLFLGQAWLPDFCLF